MPRINLLPPLVADMIAAGEVVERPASAVKELLENSIDAGARNITIEIRSGGAEYLRVTDDGCGMAPEDAGVCFLRHATSKLADERGLEAIGTLGFRGEALAAIGSVSHVELTTRERGAAEGTRLLLDGGEISDMSPCGCPEGTTIIVRGLFYNTPARLKFMKSDRAEGSACVQAAVRCALGRPEISVRCIKDGREEFFTAGDGRSETAIYSLLGRELAASLLPAATDDGVVAARGFVSAPAMGRGSRSSQYFFCNGRYIKSQLLQAAVEQACRNATLVGRYPACVMYITLAPGAVDVNVHPAKTEVKFSAEKKVFDAVYYAALGAVEEKTPPVPAPEPAAPRSAPDFTPRAPEPAREWPKGTDCKSADIPPRAFSDAAPVRQPAVHYQTRLDLPYSPPTYTPPTPPVKSETPAPVAADEPEREPVRVIGEALGLYLLMEDNGALIVIDKHAAHERLNFDALKAQGREIMSQTLLTPAPFRATGQDAELIERNMELLSELGFGIESYGAEDFILRSAPDDIEAADAPAALEEALDALRQNRRADPASARDEILKTVACKAAIKAGARSDPMEAQRLAQAVCSGQVRCCPHGRPVAWTLTRAELDKQFKRIL